MKIERLNKNFLFNTIICICALFITFIFIIFGGFIQEGYDLEIGSVSPRKFIAPSEIKNEYATQKLIDNAMNSVSPLYTHNSEVQEEVLKQIDIFFSQTDKYLTEIKENEQKGTQQNSETDNNTDEYIFQTFSPANTSKKNSISSKIYLTQQQLYILKNMDEKEYNLFKENIIKITTSALEQGIREDTQTKNLAFIKEELLNLNISKELSDIGYTIISSVIEPNLIVDEEATQKAKEDKAAEIKPVMILKNQKIVGDNEIITEEIYSILNSFGFIRKNSIFENIVPIVGICIFVIILFSAMLFYINLFHKYLCYNKKETLLLFTLYLLSIVTAKLASNIPYMFVPILSFTMLAAMLLNTNIAIMFNFGVSIICTFIYKGDINFVSYFIVTGMVVALTTYYTNERNRIFFIGLANAIINSVVMLGITMFFEKNWNQTIIPNMLYAFASGIFTLILCVGSLPFWEAVFGIVTTVKLLDLINPNKALLRRLMIEAPGTYHHSLIVANLAESAAYDIKANSILARVGGYYHDVGKLKYPQYFSENVAGENLHDYMDPYDSAKVITSHVSAGIELAQQYKLPNSVQDFIEQHHGNTLVKFFYYKAKKMYPEKDIDETDFRYGFSTPKSKETAIVMLADTVEAAVRSMIPSGKTMPEVETFVNQLIKDKLDDGQLIDSNLTMKDIETISKAFMSIFKGMYHERIPYPDGKKDTKEKNNSEDTKEK